MLTGEGWFPAIIREPTLGSRPQVGPVAVKWLGTIGIHSLSLKGRDS